MRKKNRDQSNKKGMDRVIKERRRKRKEARSGKNT